MKRQIRVKQDSFDRVGITKDVSEAICEYIWNGFEAGASLVEVTQTGQELTESLCLRIADNGSGILYDDLDDTFGAFLASKKRGLALQK